MKKKWLSAIFVLAAISIFALQEDFTPFNNAIYESLEELQDQPAEVPEKTQEPSSLEDDEEPQAPEEFGESAVPDESKQPEESALPEESPPTQTEPLESAPPLDTPDPNITEEPVESEEILDFETKYPNSIGINSNELVVYSYGDFVTAIGDADIEVLYLGVDITISQLGLTINENKSRFIIDGYDPLEHTGNHTLTEYNSTAQAGTISMNRSGSLKDITLRNLIIKGRNHYGTICIYDNIIGVQFRYEQVVYEGPQMTYNRFGSTYYTDCEITIGKFDGISAPGEVAETVNVYLSGKIIIRQADPQVNEIFFIDTGPGEIVVMPGAEVDIETYNASGFIYTTRRVTMEIGEGARFNYYGAERFWQNIPLAGLHIKAGGEMYIGSQAISQSLLRVDGDVVVDEGGALHIIRDVNSSYPVLYMNGGKLELNDPKSVLFYNQNARALMYGATNSFYSRSQQFNYWNTAGPGGFDEMPLHHWWLENEEDLTIEGTVSSAGSGNFTSLTTNHPINGEEPSIASLNLSDAKVISIGRLDLTASFNGTNDRITVETMPGAEIYAYYEEEEEPVVLAQHVYAGEDGFYLIHSPQQITDELTTIRAHWQYLYALKVISPLDNILALYDIPPTMAFQETAIPAKNEIILRADPGWAIQVYDSRGKGGRWQLYAFWNGALEAQKGETLYPLPGQLIYVDEDKTMLPLAIDGQTLIYDYRTDSDAELTSINWAEDEGILLSVAPGEIYEGISYQAVIYWVLVDGP